MALGDVKNFANNISHVYQCFLVVFLSRSEPVDLTSLMTLHRLNVRNNEESRVKWKLLFAICLLKITSHESYITSPWSGMNRTLFFLTYNVSHCSEGVNVHVFFFFLQFTHFCCSYTNTPTYEGSSYPSHGLFSQKFHIKSSWNSVWNGKSVQVTPHDKNKLWSNIWPQIWGSTVTLQKLNWSDVFQSTASPC